MIKTNILLFYSSIHKCGRFFSFRGESWFLSFEAILFYEPAWSLIFTSCLIVRLSLYELFSWVTFTHNGFPVWSLYLKSSHKAGSVCKWRWISTLFSVVCILIPKLEVETCRRVMKYIWEIGYLCAVSYLSSTEKNCPHSTPWKLQKYFSNLDSNTEKGLDNKLKERIEKSVFQRKF